VQITGASTTFVRFGGGYRSARSVMSSGSWSRTVTFAIPVRRLSGVAGTPCETASELPRTSDGQAGG
jgi:hypothetical protein